MVHSSLYGGQHSCVSQIDEIFQCIKTTINIHRIFGEECRGNLKIHWLGPMMTEGGIKVSRSLRCELRWGGGTPGQQENIRIIYNVSPKRTVVQSQSQNRHWGLHKKIFSISNDRFIDKKRPLFIGELEQNLRAARISILITHQCKLQRQLLIGSYRNVNE